LFRPLRGLVKESTPANGGQMWGTLQKNKHNVPPLGLTRSVGITGLGFTKWGSQPAKTVPSPKLLCTDITL
jgi:hypothetical protein